jgi:PilZ domain
MMSVMDQTHDFPTPEGSQREKSRESTFLGAHILFEGAKEPVSARIRNISSGGMMVDSAKSYPKDLRLTAVIKGIGEVAGQVAWATATRVGIVFDDQIDPKNARIQVKSTQPVPSYNKPYLADRRPGLAIR